MKRPAVLALVALAVAALLFLLRRAAPSGTSRRVAVAWQRQVSPGPLSAAHAFLGNDCASCHTPVTGIDAARCIACHATNEELLGRQPSAFHANVPSCIGCHVEHQGVDRRPTRMDHAELARLGRRELGAGGPRGVERQTRDQIVAWLRQHDASGAARAAHPQISAAEMTLDCASCHANKDPHFKLFGPNCAQCHGTTKWTVAGFLHPSPRSTSCAQCHQAPPSHYMGHFEMMDKAIVARGSAGARGCCADVQVNQCYRCHQTDAWNSIKGVGWFKLH